VADVDLEYNVDEQKPLVASLFADKCESMIDMACSHQDFKGISMSVTATIENV
jgi:hypothetical protein